MTQKNFLGRLKWILIVPWTQRIAQGRPGGELGVGWIGAEREKMEDICSAASNKVIFLKKILVVVYLIKLYT